MLKNLVYPVIVPVTTIGVTVAGNAFVLGKPIEELKHDLKHEWHVSMGKLERRMDKVDNGLGCVKKEINWISSQQERLKYMIQALVADCTKHKT